MIEGTLTARALAFATWKIDIFQDLRKNYAKNRSLTCSMVRESCGAAKEGAVRDSSVNTNAILDTTAKSPRLETPFWHVLRSYRNHSLRHCDFQLV